MQNRTEEMPMLRMAIRVYAGAALVALSISIGLFILGHAG